MPYNDLKYISERKKHLFLRDEIEEVIKAKNIGRGKFHEYSKQGYGDIISKFYFTFADIKNYPVGRQTLEEYNMHFREELYQEYIANPEQVRLRGIGARTYARFVRRGG